MWQQQIPDNTNLMERYYVSKIPHRDGYHEVHRMGCRYFPAERKDLGLHPSYKSAVYESQKYFANTNGCFFCLSEGHIRQPSLSQSDLPMDHLK